MIVDISDILSTGLVRASPAECEIPPVPPALSRIKLARVTNYEEADIDYPDGLTAKWVDIPGEFEAGLEYLSVNQVESKLHFYASRAAMLGTYHYKLKLSAFPYTARNYHAVDFDYSF